jgi:hypothetical protein
MVHVQSKYPIDLSEFKRPGSEIASYWFGYLYSRADIFSRGRIRVRAPLSDIRHLYQLSKDLRTIKLPRKIISEFGHYAQLIIDNKPFYVLLKLYGLGGMPSKMLNTRHVMRGLLDGGGSISRNGQGKQSKYLRIAFYSKSKVILNWIMSITGRRTISGAYHISWTGKKAIEIARQLYLDQSIYLERKLLLLSNDIF